MISDKLELRSKFSPQSDWPHSDFAQPHLILLWINSKYTKLFLSQTHNLTFKDFKRHNSHTSQRDHWWEVGGYPEAAPPTPLKYTVIETLPWPEFKRNAKQIQFRSSNPPEKHKQRRITYIVFMTDLYDNLISLWFDHTMKYRTKTPPSWVLSDLSITFLWRIRPTFSSDNSSQNLPMVTRPWCLDLLLFEEDSAEQIYLRTVTRTSPWTQACNCRIWWESQQSAC